MKSGIPAGAKNLAVLSFAMAVALLATPALAQKFDGLSKTPALGWNSGNKFGCDVSEQVIRETADAMVANGMKAAGYTYVNLDDCWQGERDARGFIQPDKKRFPSGMKALADYVHSKGLKLGIHSDAGWKTCGGRPGSRGYEFPDALMYAEWGIDYLRYGWCSTEGLKAEGAYLTMREALRKAGRPILFSVSEWGASKPWEWAKNIGHSWRTSGDLHPCFDCVEDHGAWKSWGVLQVLDQQAGLRVHAGPDHWNDADVLEVGNGMAVNEDRAHFSLWAMLTSPLIAGTDIRSMSPDTTAILTNKSVIAVNQDVLGVQAFQYAARDGVEYWFKPLSDDSWAMLILNRNPDARSISFDWKAEKVGDTLSKLDAAFTRNSYRLRNLWTERHAGNTLKPLAVEVPGHDVLMFRLSPGR